MRFNFCKCNSFSAGLSQLGAQIFRRDLGGDRLARGRKTETARVGQLREQRRGLLARHEVRPAPLAPERAITAAIFSRRTSASDTGVAKACNRSNSSRSTASAGMSAGVPLTSTVPSPQKSMSKPRAANSTAFSSSRAYSSPESTSRSGNSSCWLTDEPLPSIRR